ncbi:MAG TPA: hydrogenase maturation protease [Acidimicrobiales bacterium]|jgi:hydrogenase maturation protease|nr:hydrogenase maturation protease [Acidimicrobiales bacterium]
MSRGVLVAGIGNIFQTDDAFGVEVAQRLAERALPTGVRVEDFGIRGLHLAYELLEGYDGLVIIDAVPMGEPAGTLAVIEPELGQPGDDTAAPVVDAHTMSPDVVLASLAYLGGSVDTIFIVGCQPADLQDGMGLTPAVAAAVNDAVEMCCQLASEIVQPVGRESRS